MENKKIEQLNDKDLEKVNGGAGEVKGNRNYNPLRTCPECGARGKTGYADGHEIFACDDCNKWFWFEDDGSLHCVMGG